MWYDTLFTWACPSFRDFALSARGAADDDMQMYQGTEVGGWMERYQTVTHSIPQPIRLRYE
jgi:hypothetical protein